MNAVSCRTCGHPAICTDAFCEACGNPLLTATAARAEQVSGSAAAVSDIGLRRERNEDAFALSSSADRASVVVCDGVASTPSAGSAAALTARTSLATLTAGLASGVRSPVELAALMRSSLSLAHTVVSELSRSDAPGILVDPADPRDGSPSTTCVAAVAVGTTVLVTGIGDSRAYWVPAGGQEQLLTVDDTEPGAVLAPQPTSAGRSTVLTRHLTRWVGADDPGGPQRVNLLEVASPGVLVLCTDGLWQYFDRPGDLAALIGPQPVERDDGLAVARRLVAGALAAGGGDNITAAVLALGPPTPADGS